MMEKETFQYTYSAKEQEEIKAIREKYTASQPEEDKMAQLARLEIHPLRIAFDHADEENVKIYVRAQKLAAKYKIKTLSNYILFNFNDTPKELYDRLKINIELNEEFNLQGLKTSIWSFPMKYMPISGEHCKDRKYIGKHWNAKMLRGVQCICLFPWRWSGKRT